MRRMYSKKQLQEEALQGLVNADVKVKTIEQSEPNWSISFEPEMSTSAVAKGLTITNIYNRLQVINNILYIVMVNKVLNETGSAISYGSPDGVSGEITLPEEIADKIYDINGKKLSETGTGSVDISSNPNGIQTGVGYAPQRMSLTHNGVNKLKITLEPSPSLSITASNSVSTFGRTFLTLI